MFIIGAPTIINKSNANQYKLYTIISLFLSADCLFWLLSALVESVHNLLPSLVNTTLLSIVNLLLKMYRLILSTTIIYSPPNT